jgi:hypothetical protein
VAIPVCRLSKLIVYRELSSLYMFVKTWWAVLESNQVAEQKEGTTKKTAPFCPCASPPPHGMGWDNQQC